MNLQKKKEKNLINLKECTRKRKKVVVVAVAHVNVAAVVVDLYYLV